MVPGGTRNRHLSIQREKIPAAVKMPMVSLATRSAMRPSMKRLVSSMKAEIPLVVEQPLASWCWIRMAREAWAARRVVVD